MVQKNNCGSVGNKVILAKITREDFSEFKCLCDANHETINATIKRLISNEINNPTPMKVAGKSVFAYNPAKDNFGWRVVLDKGVTSYIEDDLNFEYLSQLKEAIDKAIDERNTFIQKKKNDSVAIPGRLVRKGL